MDELLYSYKSVVPTDVTISFILIIIRGTLFCDYEYLASQIISLVLDSAKAWKPNLQEPNYFVHSCKIRKTSLIPLNPIRRRISRGNVVGICTY